MTARATLAGPAALLLALVLAAPAAATATPDCTTPPLATITVTGPTHAKIETKAANPNEVFVDNVSFACTGLNHVVILGDGAANDIEYIGGLGGVDVDATLGNGNDIFSATSALPVDLIEGEGDDDTLTGGTGPDVLSGGPGNDTLVGGDGNDTLLPGAGNGSNSGGNGVDTVSYAGLANGVTATLGGIVTGGPAIPVSQSITADVENFIGTSFVDDVTGSPADNALTGGDGGDTLRGAAGADALSGGNGDDSLFPGDGNGSNAGGADTDTVSYAGLGNGVTATLGGSATGAPAIPLSQSLNVDIENLTGTDSSDTLTGSAVANVLRGGDGNDALSGGAGDDTLVPGIGNGSNAGGPDVDTVTYAGLGNGVTATLGGSATGAPAIPVSQSLNVDIENLTGTSFADDVTGSTVANALTGGDGADTLRGLGGDDALNGGNGDDDLFPGAGNGSNVGGADTDIVSYAGLTNGVTAGLGGLATGAPAIPVSQSLNVDIENLTGTDHLDTLTGSSLANVLRGLDGDDALAGGDGNDTLFPGTGDGTNVGGNDVDTVSYAGLGNGVNATLGGTATGAPAIPTSQSLDIDIENLIGTVFVDELTGSPVANELTGGDAGDTLTGGDGDDTLSGGDGDDTLLPGGGNGSNAGGNGVDTVSYEGLTNGVTATLGGTATGAPAIPTSQSLNVDIENLTGTDFDDDLTGSGVANELRGLDGSDTLTGGAGDDTLFPGEGNGSNAGGGDVDTVSYAGLGNGVTATLAATATGAPAIPVSQSLNVDIENVIGTSFDDDITGSAVANALTGGDGADMLRGEDGDDVLSGGNGDDTLLPGNGNGSNSGGADTDIVSYSGLGNGVTATLGGTATGAPAIPVSQSLNVDIENLTGTSFDDDLTGSAVANVLTGNAGADTLRGLGGDDTLSGGNGDDTLLPGDGNGANSGGADNDTVSYAGLSNGVTATLGGTATGAPAIPVSQSLNADIENLTGSSFDDDLTGSALANVLTGGDGADTLRGLDGSDTLTGGAGDDTLFPGEGNGSNAGGGDVDTVSYAGLGNGVTATLAATATGAPAIPVSQSLNVDIENVIGTSFDDDITGSAVANALTGGDGADMLRGEDGDDVLSGGNGDDTLLPGNGNGSNSGGADTDIVSYSGLGNGVTATLGGTATGAPAIPVSQSLNVDIENLTGTSFDDDLTGSAVANVLTGNAGADTLRGLGGDDTLSGGNGDDTLLPGDGNGANSGGADNDTVSYAGLSNGVTATLGGTATGAPAIPVSQSLNADIENLTGSSFDDDLTGTAGADVLTGGDGADTLRGLDGDDVLSGGNGDDTLLPGDGNGSNSGGADTDTVSYAGLSNGVTATLGGSATGAPAISVSQSLNVDIENVIGTSFDDDLTGSAVANVLTGGDGADTLRGLDGADTLSGGNGDDTLLPGNGNGSNSGGADTDTISYAGLTNGVTATLGGLATGAPAIPVSQSLNVDIENLTGTSFDDDLTGTVAANVLTGGDGADTLRGLDGADTLSGGNGDDTLLPGNGNGSNSGGADNDTVSYAGLSNGVTATLGGTATGTPAIPVSQSLNADIENLTGSSFDDDLTGTAGADALTGGDGADTLRGLDGDDTLSGGNGDDTLLPGNGNGSNNGGADTDTVSYAGLGNAITATLGGTATGAPAIPVSQSLNADIENLIGTSFGDDITGSALANALTGGDGADTLRGLDGADTLSGGNGDDNLFPGAGGGSSSGGADNDTVSYADLPNGVTATLGGSATGGPAILVPQSLNVDIENLTGSSFGDDLTGSAIANVLTGGDGADTLRGLGGDDTLSGGNGDDTLLPGDGNGANSGGADTDTVSYADLSNGVTATLAATATGAPAIPVSQSLNADIENLTGSSFDDDLTGTATANVLTGNAGADTLRGLDGDDTLSGGNGDDTLLPGNGNGANNGGADTDTVSYAGLGNAITATLGGTATGAPAIPVSQSLNVDIENLIGTSFDDDITGSAVANALTGGDGADTLRGLDAADTLSGGNGDDTLLPGNGNGSNSGGADNDTVSYAGLTNGVTATLGGSATGAPAIPGSQSLNVDIENLTGSSFGDDLTGSALANVLTGGDGADTLRGLAGDDTLSGGIGDDTLFPGDGNGSNAGGPDTDTVSYAGLGNAITATLGGTATGAPAIPVSQSLNVDIENLIGTSFGDDITGSAIANALTGGDGADTLRGLDGDDVLSGGNGDDTLLPGNGNGANSGGADTDTVSYAGLGNGVTATLGGTATGAPAIPLSQSLNADIENLTGSSFDDDLTGTAAANVLTGNAGADALRGLDGDDTLSGGNGDDTLLPGNGNGANSGGADTDTVSYAGLGNGVTATLGGTATGAPAIPTSQSLNADIENLTGSSFDDDLTGTAAANVLTGGDGADALRGLDGDDTLSGGNGNDTLLPGNGNGSNSGGAGIDTVSYAGAGNGVTATLGGTATGAPAIPVSQSLNADIENLTGTSFGDDLTGSAIANALTGGDGADTLRGLDGDDVLSGGNGDDTLLPGDGNGANAGGADTDTVSYAGLGNAITATLGGTATGAPAIPVSQSLNADIENLTGTDSPDMLTGSPVANVLRGGNGDDTLIGALGNDTLDGQGGTDTVSYADRVAGEAVVATLAAPTPGGGAGAEADTFASIENLTGGTGADSLTGDGGPNTLLGGPGADALRGGAGVDVLEGETGADQLFGGDDVDTLRGGDDNDVLEGGLGNDALDGGNGADTASYADRSASEPVTAAIPGGGGATGEADTYTSIENLAGGAGDDTLTQGPGDGDLSGNGGNDTLRPGLGTGTVNGGAGSDTADYSGLADPLTANLATGSATATGLSHTLAGDVENVTGGDAADSLTGSAVANVLRGGPAADTIVGGAGADTLDGEGDNDTITGGAGDDVIEGSAGNDTLTGDEGADVLTGGQDTDTVSYAAKTQRVVVTLDGIANDGVGGTEGDNVVSTENLVGGSAGDRLVGDQAANLLQGGPGDDELVGAGNSDLLEGGDGRDTASYDDHAADNPVRVSLADGPPGGGGRDERDTLDSIEVLRGGAGPDTLIGTTGNEGLFGGPGADTLVGGGGDDVVSGEDGNDQLVGEEGDDALSGAAGADRIDGGLGADVIDAGADNDDINAFDGITDLITCGEGSDRLDYDRFDSLAAGDCEFIRIPGEIPAAIDAGPDPVRDRDSDGALGPVGGPDCNDLDAAIRPGAPEIPGNGIDENCDNVDAPFPQITTDLRLSGGPRGKGVRIKLILLTRVPASAKIEVRCTSKQSPKCLFKTRTRTVGARRVARLSLRGLFGDRALSRTTVIEVRVTAPNAIGKAFKLTLKSAKKTVLCLPPGATKPVKC